MAIQAVAYLKNLFKTGAKPPQGAFWDWLDSFRHKSDKIVFDDLDSDLQTTITDAGSGGGGTNTIALAQGTASFVLPAGTLVTCILFLDNTNPAGVSIGITSGGDEVAGADDVRNGSLANAMCLYKTFDITLYFNNITANTITIIYKAI